MAAIECIGVTFTAATVAGSIGAAFTGDSLTIRNCPLGAQLVNTWAGHQTGALGVVVADNIRSPRMHDSTQGIRLLNVSTAAIALMTFAVPQLPVGQSSPLVSQDTLSVMIQGTAAAGDVENRIIEIYYPSLPGSEQNLIGYLELQKRLVNLVTVQVGLTAAGVAGNWSGAAALNATFDLLKANTNYALLGGSSTATGSTPCAIGVRGADTANLRVAYPGHPNPIHTRGWFVDNARAFGLPMIPVINSANKANTMIEVSSDENASNYVAFLNFAELKG
jgi:hypothetical protein